MKTKHLFLITIFTILSLITNGQCRDSITESFSLTLPSLEWSANSMTYGSPTSPNICPSCPRTGSNYLYFNGIGDYIRTPLIPNPSIFSFWYKRSTSKSSDSTAFRIVVETSSNNLTWNTILQITSLSKSIYQIASVAVNAGVFVRIRDQRDSVNKITAWYLDDIKWVWEKNVGVWTGNVSSDWNNTANWCKGQLPTSADSVLIPTGTPYACVLASGTGNCKNLTIQSGAVLTIGGTLKIAGTITSTSNINVRGGTIELNGSTAQTIKGSNLSSKLIGNLIISNPSGVSFGTSSTDSLKLLNSLTFTTTNATLTTGGALTLCSSDTMTARIGELGSNRIIGNVVVERYIPNHTKAWQLLSIPTMGQTINASLQEGNVALGNTKLGYGTIITGTGTGFDITTALPSMKTYNPTTGLWDGITSTSSLVNTNKGYMIFVRGDRSVTAYNQSATSTKLRTTGILYTPIDNPPPTINVLADKYESVNNFYASSIDFSKLGRTGGVQNAYYIWDPKLTNSSVSAYGYGGYQTFVWNGLGYDVVPGGGSYVNGNTNIESGQAFFVKTFGSSGTISFSESAKSTTSSLVTRNSNNDMSITTNLSVVSGGNTILIDGVMSKFGSRYSNSIDVLDIRKISNTEGIGLIRDSIKLTAEYRKNVSRVDTIFFNLTQLRVQTYQLDFRSQNMVNIRATLVDNFLGTSTPLYLIGGSEILFNVTSDPASFASNRFYLIVGHERTGALKETNINSGTITASPNPVMGSNVSIKLNGFNTGKYTIKIMDVMGNIVLSKDVFHLNETSIHTLDIGKGYSGVYELILTSPTIEPQSLTLIIK